MPETFKMDITPVGMRTNEGIDRVNKAQDAWESQQAEVANYTNFFLKNHADLIMVECPSLREEIEELREKCRVMLDLQEEFLQAVGGRPPRA
jgi:hypothetical protein